MELKGKAIDVKSLEFTNVDYRNENVNVVYGEYEDGQALSEAELDALEDKYTAELHALFMDRL